MWNRVLYLFCLIPGHIMADNLTTEVNTATVGTNNSEVQIQPPVTPPSNTTAETSGSLELVIYSKACRELSTQKQATDCTQCFQNVYAVKRDDFLSTLKDLQKCFKEYTFPNDYETCAQIAMGDNVTVKMAEGSILTIPVSETDRIVSAVQCMQDIQTLISCLHDAFPMNFNLKSAIQLNACYDTMIKKSVLLTPFAWANSQSVLLKYSVIGRMQIFFTNLLYELGSVLNQSILKTVKTMWPDFQEQVPTIKRK